MLYGIAELVFGALFVGAIVELFLGSLRSLFNVGVE